MVALDAAACAYGGNGKPGNWFAQRRLCPYTAFGELVDVYPAAWSVVSVVTLWSTSCSLPKLIAITSFDSGLTAILASGPEGNSGERESRDSGRLRSTDWRQTTLRAIVGGASVDSIRCRVASKRPAPERFHLDQPHDLPVCPCP